MNNQINNHGYNKDNYEMTIDILYNMLDKVAYSLSTVIIADIHSFAEHPQQTLVKLCGALICLIASLQFTPL